MCCRYWFDSTLHVYISTGKLCILMTCKLKSSNILARALKFKVLFWWYHTWNMYICKPQSWHLILEPEDQLTGVKHLSLLICSWSLKTEWQLTLDIFDKQNKTVMSLDLMTATDWTKNDTGYSLVKPNFWSNGSQDKMYEYCTILSTDWVNRRETYESNEYLDGNKMLWYMYK